MRHLPRGEPVGDHASRLVQIYQAEVRNRKKDLQDVTPPSPLPGQGLLRTEDSPEVFHRWANAGGVYRHHVKVKIMKVGKENSHTWSRRKRNGDGCPGTQEGPGRL